MCVDLGGDRAAVNAPRVDVHTVADGAHNDTWVKAGTDYVIWLREFLFTAGR